MWTHNNQSLVYTNWAPGYLNIKDSDACCVIDSSEDGKWKDVSCDSSTVTQFICKQSGEYQNGR